MQSILDWFKSGTMVVKLLTINVLVFFVVGIVGVFVNFSGQIGHNGLVDILAANSNVIHTLSRPWSIITYMFLHQGLGHIFWNMILLTLAGKLFTSFLGENRILPTYLLGGISGLFLYILCYNIFPIFKGYNSPIIGASAAVIAILVAVASYVPNYSVPLRIIGPIKLKYIAIFYIAIDFIALQNTNPNSNLGGHIAHIGGAIYGYVMVKQLAKGKDWSKIISAYFTAFIKIFSRKPKIRVVHKNPKHRRPVSDQEYNANKKARQEQIDRILDKISKSGYDSLTKEEKALLFQVSKEQ